MPEPVGIGDVHVHLGGAGFADSAPSPSAAVRRPSPIDAGFGALEGAVSDCALAADNLIEALRPVLGDPLPMAEAQETDPRAPSSEVASRLADLRSRVDGLTRTLISAGARLEV